MKFVNRGYLIVKPTKLFIDWANKNDEDYANLVDSEATIYLVEEDFYDDEQVLKANFKDVFINELRAVTEDESEYPEIKLGIFHEWLAIEMGTSVFDAQSNRLVSD